MPGTPTLHDETDDAVAEELAYRDLEASDVDREEEEDDDDSELAALDADDLMYMDGPDA